MPKEQSVVVTLSVPVSLRDSFKACCYAEDTTPSQQLRKYMRDYIKKHGQADLFK